MRLVVLVVLVTMGVGAAAADSGGAKRITLDVRDADLAAVVKAIFEQAGKNYSISEDVRGTVTAYIDDRPFEEALRVILSPRGFVWRVVDSTYVVGKKPKPEPKDRDDGTPPVPPRGDDAGQEDKATVVEKFPLNFIDAYELVAILQGGTQPFGNARGYGPAGAGNYPGGQRNQWAPGQPMYGGTGGYGPNYGGYGASGFGWGVQSPGAYGYPYQSYPTQIPNPAQPANPAPPTR